MTTSKTQSGYDTTWYSDNFISLYSRILNKRFTENFVLSPWITPEFSSGGFDAVANWIKFSIKSKKLLLFPILKNHHWTLITANTLTHEIIHYNSYQYSDLEAIFAVKSILQNWQNVSKIPVTEWNWTHGKTPTQKNDFDCGPWVIETMKNLVLHLPIQFKQENMQKIRKEHLETIKSKSINLNSLSKNKKKQQAANERKRRNKTTYQTAKTTS
jgi:Ulp1 family protease